MKQIKVGSDFSGVGAFNQALMRLGIEYKEVFACDMDKYARQTFIDNYGEPKYYPKNVYEREIPTESLDIYMTSPPCQAFSLAGKRLGKDDKRGILFFNSLEFIQVNKPRYFIFENVKGLLSDDGGKTFSEWVNLLGGKSVNSNPVLFPYDDAVPYHLYWQVLNAKEHGVPQNRERVFLVGIRDDEDNNFRFPIEETLTKRLKDVLEDEVDDKYFLSEAAINKCLKSQANENMLDEDIPDKSRCIVAGYYKQPFDGQYLKIKSGTSKGYEEATEGDSINFSVPNSETRRGRVGKGVAQTLDTGCQQGVMIGAFRGRNPDNPSDRTTGTPTEQRLEINQDGVSNTLTSVQKDNVLILGYTRDAKGNVVKRNIWNEAGTIHTSSGSGGNTDQFVVQYNDKRLNETISKNELPEGEIKIIDTYNQSIHDECPTLKKHHAENGDRKLWDGYKIRRLTPRECFRLMDFPDSFIWTCSDSQAYKQAGNSIVVNVLYKIIKNLNL
jgi:DNA (cytosine-5)-methyltransferase 1